MNLQYTPKLLTVLADPDPFLRRNSKIVENPKDPEIQELIQDMIFTMREQKGIGLAAVQVSIDLCILVIETKDGAVVFVNPEIVELSNNAETGEEGCLSLPGRFGFVSRKTTISVKSLDARGNQQIHDAEGLFARVLQHEIDHLSGILFIDKLVEPDPVAE